MIWESDVYKLTTGTERLRRQFLGGSLGCILAEKGSPYYAYQGETIILDLCKGNRRQVENPFHWAELVLKSPPDTTYDPSFPRVMKLRNDGELACNEATYVDDIHVAGLVVGETNPTQLACKQLNSSMNCLGNQADDCKY